MIAVFLFLMNWCVNLGVSQSFVEDMREIYSIMPEIGVRMNRETAPNAALGIGLSIMADKGTFWVDYLPSKKDTRCFIGILDASWEKYTSFHKGGRQYFGIGISVAYGIEEVEEKTYKGTGMGIFGFGGHEIKSSEKCSIGIEGMLRILHIEMGYYGEVGYDLIPSGIGLKVFIRK